jgi:cation:H+ antiporter
VTALLLVVSIALIVVGAYLFTNAVEWAGQRLNLGHGAVGSILAAVGTALPESVIPIVAVLAGTEGEEVAIGAIIGAPFMLATVAMLVIAASALAFAGRRETGSEIHADRDSVRRDLGFFLPCFAVAIGLGLIDSKAVHIVGIAGLLIAYVLHVRQTLRHTGDADDEEELKALTFDTTKDDPPSTFQIVAQFVVGLGLVIGGAELFVTELVKVAEGIGVTALALSLILTPLATELPEKLNSVFWMRESKDTLAVGNVTGAMAFQATVPVAFGLAVTQWHLDKFAVAAGVLALLGGALALWRLERRSVGKLSAVAWAGLFGALIVVVGMG